MRATWFGHIIVDMEEEGIYIWEAEFKAGFRQKKPSRYCRVAYEELPQLIDVLKEICEERKEKERR